MELLQSCTKPSIYSKLIMEGKLIIQHKQNEPVCMSHGTYCVCHKAGRSWHRDLTPSEPVQGPSQYKNGFPRYRVSHYNKIRRPWDRLIFMMGIPIPVRWHLYISIFRWVSRAFHKIWTRSCFYFALRCLYDPFLCEHCPNILQSCFTDTNAIMWLPQCQWSYLERYG